MSDAHAAAAAAFDALSAEAEEAPAQAQETPDEPAESAAADAEPAQEAASGPRRNETLSERIARQRDEGGRFAKEQPKPKVEVKPQLQAPQAKDGKTPAAPQTAEAKVPNALSAVERESWKAWPKEAQAYAQRREVEYARALQKSAEGAKQWDGFSKVLEPFVPQLRAAGMDVGQSVGQALRVQHQLMTGNEVSRAQAMAGLIQQFLPDSGAFNALNAILSGQAAPQGRPAPQQPAPDQLAKFLRSQGFLTQEDVAKQRQEAHVRAATSDIESFSQSHPYLDDVRGLMGTLMDSAHQQGLEMDMERAYTIACQATPSVAEVLAKQTRASAAQVPPSRLRAAAGSLRSRPSMPTGNEGQRPRTAREAAAAAFDTLSGG